MDLAEIGSRISLTDELSGFMSSRQQAAKTVS